MSTDAPAAPTRPRLSLSPTEAAEALGLCRATVYNMVARGDLRTVKIGRRTLIPVTELTRLLGGDAG